MNLAIILIMIVYAVSVSYTHLDVYKRQMLTGIKINSPVRRRPLTSF